jgi:sarcosine oxidase subunit gamma
MVQAGLPGVYPVLREDWAFLLAGSEVHGMLAEVSSVDFAALALDLRPLVMTSMAGVGVLVVPQALAGERRYRIWCDPSFGPYLCETLGAVVVDCGGTYRGAAV